MNPEQELTHLDDQGHVQMVDVGNKTVTARTAVAQAIIRLSPETTSLVSQGELPKGNVLTTARIAGIQAAKRTGELIPLAHNISLTHVGVEFDIDPRGVITILASASTRERTGVEMEALTACSVAALTIYDMVKGVERGVTIEKVSLLSKTGGKENWQSDDK